MAYWFKNIFMQSFFCAAVLLSSCSNERVAVFPCFDGWSSDKYGESTLWEPSKDLLARIRQDLPQDRKIACMHMSRSGMVTILNWSDSNMDMRYATEYDPSKNKLYLSDESVLVTLHND